MFIRKTLTGLAAASLVIGSTAAAAAPVAADRSGSSVAKSDDVAGMGTFTLLLGLLIVAGVIAVVASKDNGTAPTSP